MSPRVRDALRNALGVLIVTLICMAIHSENPYWAATTVYILMVFHAGTQLRRGLWQIVATIGGVTLGCTAASLGANNQPLFLILIFLIMTTVVYLYLTGKYPVIWILFGLTSFLSMLFSIINPANLFDVAFWRIFEVGIAVVVTLFLNTFLFPVRLADLFLSVLDELGEAQAALLFGGDRKEVEKLIGKGKSLLLALRESRRELTFSPNIAAELLARHEDLLRELTHLDCPMSDELKEELAHLLRSTNVLKGDPPEIDVRPLGHPELDTLLFTIEDAFHLRRDLGVLDVPGRRKINVRALKQGIRQGISAIAMLYIWLVSGWSQMAIGVVMALLVGTERNTTITFRTGLLRLVGILAAGIVAMGAFSFLVQDIVTLSAVVFIATFFFSYLAGGTPSMAFIGIQGGFSFLLVTVTSSVFTDALALPLERLAGLLIGVVVSGLMAHILWPFDVMGELKKGLSKNFRLLARLVHLRSRGEYEEVPAILASLVDTHRDNLDSAGCLKDARWQNIVRLQTDTILHMRTIGERVDLKKMIPELQKEFDLKRKAELIEEFFTRFAEGEVIPTNELESVLTHLEEQLKRSGPAEARPFLFYVRHLLSTLVELGDAYRLVDAPQKVRDLAF